MDIYVVMDGMTLVGASAAMQGAEVLRADRALLLADRLHHGDRGGGWNRSQQIIYDRQKIVNLELQDV